MSGRRDLVGRLEDGTPFYAPMGQVPYDAYNDRVQCHLCGRWLRQLPGPHLKGLHAMGSDDYRELFRLGTHGRARPSTLERRSELLKDKLEIDTVWQEGFATGQAMCSSGELSRRAVRRAVGSSAEMASDSEVVASTASEMFEHAIASRAGITSLPAYLGLVVARGAPTKAPQRS